MAENVEIQQTVSFQGEATAPAPILRTVPQFKPMGDEDSGDVRKILARPKFLTKVPLDGTGSQDQGINLNFPLDRQFYDQYFDVSNRFSGCLGIRFTTCFKVLLAAAPQVGGRLRCFYDPVQVSTSGQSSTFKDTTWMHFDMTAYTQLPGAELDVESGTAIEYKIPYTHFLEYIPLKSIQENGSINDPVCLGSFNLVEYLKVQVPVGAAIPYATVYVWLEDIEVIGARNANLVPEFFPPIESQAGVEEDIERDGPLSGPLYKLSKAASLVGGAIPLLSSVSTPVSWAMRISSNLAAAFGYSRPLQLEQNHRFWPTNNAYQNNADGPDTSFNLGLLQDNKVEFSECFSGTNIDEMSIAYIVRKFAALDRFTCTVDFQGRMYEVALCPNAMYQGTSLGIVPFAHPPYEWTNSAFNPLDFPTDVGGNVVVPTPNFWLSQMFKIFRGGYKIRVKCNKTRFHGGRILLMFTPYSYGQNDRTLWSPNVTESGIDESDLYGHSVVWDLRESCEAELDCPFVALSSYLDNAVPFGTFSMHVVDNITAPENVTQSLTFVVEVAGMDDFEFALPYTGHFMPNPNDDYRTSVESQSGGIVSDVSCDVVGERILSLKQLLNRVEYTDTQGYTNYTPKMTKGMELETFYTPYNFMYWDSFVSKRAGRFKLSTHDLITPAFAFARGSTCYDTLNVRNDNALLQCVTYSPYNTFDQNGDLGVNGQIWERDRYLHVKDPFYSKTMKVPTNPMYYPITPVAPGLNPITTIGNYLTKQLKPIYYGMLSSMMGRRAGDDAQLGFFLAAPRLLNVKGGSFSTSDTVITGTIDQTALALRFEELHTT